MDFLGVGPLELFFIIIVALIVLGPRDMVKAGRTLGRWMRNIVMSPTWMAIKETSQNLRLLPNKLMREANLEEPLQQIQKDLQQTTQQTNRALLGASEELQKEIKGASDELQTTSKDLSAWTAPPPPPQAANSSTNNLSAWLTPPEELSSSSPEPSIAPPDLLESTDEASHVESSENQLLPTGESSSAAAADQEISVTQAPKKPASTKKTSKSKPATAKAIEQDAVGEPFTQPELTTNTQSPITDSDADTEQSS